MNTPMNLINLIAQSAIIFVGTPLLIVFSKFWVITEETQQLSMKFYRVFIGISILLISGLIGICFFVTPSSFLGTYCAARVFDALVSLDGRKMLCVTRELLHHMRFPSWNNETP